MTDAPESNLPPTRQGQQLRPGQRATIVPAIPKEAEEAGGEPVTSEVQKEVLKRDQGQIGQRTDQPLQSEFPQQFVEKDAPQFYQYQQTTMTEFWVPQPQTFSSGKSRTHLEQAIGPALRQRLAETPAKAIAPNLKQIAFARSSDSIASVMYKLRSHGILSMPLLEVDKMHFDTFIDMLDILSYIVKNANLTENIENLKEWDWDKRMKLFEATPCSELLKTRVGRHPWYTVHRDTSLQQIINYMVMKQTHRMVLTDDKGQFSSVITQHRIVQWLSNRRLDEFGDFGGLTIHDLDLGLKPVATVNFNDRVITAMLKMYELHFSGLGVLGVNNELVGNISVTDLKDIGEAAQWYSKLFMGCHAFKSITHEGAGLPALVYSTPRAMLKEVMSKFANNYIHRVYIVEKATHKPLGVVTCSDILNLFAKSPNSQYKQQPSSQ